jgi:hypothetical protein
VIVREAPGAGEVPERQVRALGGTVGRHIRIIRGFVADVPAGAVASLERSAGVASVSLNRRIQMQGFPEDYDPDKDLGSLFNLNRSIYAPEMWKKGYTGEGVDIALIDTGVLPVEGLDAPGKVVNGPDLSFESQLPNLRHLDSYGHGTHMAGIMAGRDADAEPGHYEDEDHFVGVAPDARIVSVKVADYHGGTDVSQVLAAIDWVVQHRRDGDLNIRVLNLSFGTDGIQDYRIDPLAYAAEVAWRRGIVVVVAAGNAGYGSAQLNNPAHDPFVIAVGADNTKATPDPRDDVVPAWSSTGDGTRNPDVVAPGQSVSSLRAPGSYIDVRHPEGVVNDRLFKGSGTSQAAAAVSGAAALILEQRPGATPDQVKRLLMATATPLPNTRPIAQGEGLINLKEALEARTAAHVQTWQRSIGIGSIDAARGSAHLMDKGVPLAGEIDIFGNPWVGEVWAPSSLAGTSWKGGSWNGHPWTGDCWCGESWTAMTWSGKTWSGTTWSGKTWSALAWSGKTWSGKTWSGGMWTGKTWSSKGWSGKTWSSAAYG